MKHFRWISLSLLGGLLLTAAATRATADEWNKKTYVTLSQPIEVPGAVLPPGQYVFKLMDSNSNRHIVQILNDRENHVYSTVLAFAKQRMEPSDKTILTFYEMPGGGPEPIRSWFYPGDTIGQEFAYPKHRALEISQAVNVNVPTVADSATPAVEPTPAPTPAPAVAPEPEPAPAPAATQADLTDHDVSQMEPSAAPAPGPAEPELTPAPQDPPAEPAMPKTASDLWTLGLIGVGCLSAGLAIRSGSRRARRGQ